MLHRAICGSLERFIGVLIEHYAGKFPLWLSPLQVVVAPITSECNDYGEEILKKLADVGIRANLDGRNEKINYKVREHSLQKIPVLFVVGKREKENNQVAIRRLGSEAQTVVALDEAINDLIKEIQSKK
jgi:threonyl-tRNA synthetase